MGTRIGEIRNRFYAHGNFVYCQKSGIVAEGGQTRNKKPLDNPNKPKSGCHRVAPTFVGSLADFPTRKTTENSRMNQLLENYRKVYEQGFMPIFVDDSFDTLMLVEACVSAGFAAIEYTLRRKDANTMIPLIKERYPDLAVLVGSTLDDDGMVERMRNRHPQLLTLDELDSIGVDGFVSQLSWSERSIRKYCPVKS